MSLSVYRLLRNFRTMSAGPFYQFNQKVYKSFRDKSKLPEAILASIIASNPELFQNYFATSEKHDAVFREASYGHKLSISEREVLQAQLVICLDEIALLVETAALRNPDIVICSGFDVAKERRGTTRTKAAIAASAALAATGQEDHQP